MKDMIRGEMSLCSKAKAIGERIYHEAVPVEDSRFSHYMQRRHIHMIKLAIVLAASDLSSTIEPVHILRSNTMLAMAEKKMPKALGEFGESKYSNVSNKILEYLATRHKPINANELWKVVQKDLNAPSQLNDVLLNLKTAEKIQTVTVLGKSGYLPMNKIAMEWKECYLDMDWLTQQERL